MLLHVHVCLHVTGGLHVQWFTCNRWVTCTMIFFLSINGALLVLATRREGECCLIVFTCTVSLEFNKVKLILEVNLN